MKKKVLVWVAALLILVSMTAVLSGCFRNVLYGTWKMTAYSKINGEDESEPPMNVYITLVDDGTVYMYDSLLGTWEYDRENFTLTLTDEDSAGSEIWTGGWVVSGDYLYLYMDSHDVKYTFQKVEE